MKFTEGKAMLVILSVFAIVILGGYCFWRGYLKPFLGKRRFLKAKVENAPNEHEAMFWQEELQEYYKSYVPILRHFIKK